MTSAPSTKAMTASRRVVAGSTGSDQNACKRRAACAIGVIDRLETSSTISESLSLGFADVDVIIAAHRQYVITLQHPALQLGPVRDALQARQRDNFGRGSSQLVQKSAKRAAILSCHDEIVFAFVKHEVRAQVGAVEQHKKLRRAVNVDVILRRQPRGDGLKLAALIFERHLGFASVTQPAHEQDG